VYAVFVLLQNSNDEQDSSGNDGDDSSGVDTLVALTLLQQMMSKILVFFVVYSCC